MAKDNLVVCYEGIQRIYRNAVVRHIRGRMNESFAADAATKLKLPFQKEWETMRQNAIASRNSGELASGIADDFDLLSVGHFFNLFDSYYDTLVPSHSNLSETDKKRQKQALLTWSKTIKNLRDPLSHPTEEDFPTEDAFVLLDCARRVLEGLGLSDSALELRLLNERLLGGPASAVGEREPLDDRLPPRDTVVVDFVGRGKELASLSSWFSDPVSRRWALAGEGGKGKSALAYNFALEIKIKAPQPFQTVLWMSAKVKKFMEGSTVPIARPDFFDLDSALVCLLTHYGWLDEIELPTESKRKRVLELLNEFPALIVVDDIDSLESANENVTEFFGLEVPTTRSKVLFTSRRTIFGMGGSTTHIGGLSEDDAARFILSRCELLELEPSLFSKEVIRRITTATEGSPLYIEDLMRLTASVGSAAEAIKQWVGRSGDEARKYALGRECELLTPAARTILFAACTCSNAISFTELEAVAGRTEEEVTTALQELQRLFLVLKPRLIEGEQRFEVNVNTRALVRDVYGTSDEYRRVATAYRTITKGLPETDRGDIGALIRQAIFHTRSNRHLDAEKLLTSAMRRFPSNPSIIGVLGLVYKAWDPPRVTDAREQFKRAWQLKCARQETYEHWCQMELREREWTKAAEAAEKGLKILPNSRLLLELAGYARSRLGRELLAGQHEERAAQEFTEAKRLLLAALRAPGSSDYRDRALNASIYRALVLLCDANREVKNLQHYLRLWLTEYPDDETARYEASRLSAKHGFSLETIDPAFGITPSAPVAATARQAETPL